MAAETKPIQPVCSTCGGTDVSRDAWASWDIETQTWQLGAVFDDAYCHSCGSACRLIDTPAGEVG